MGSSADNGKVFDKAVQAVFEAILRKLRIAFEKMADDIINDALNQRQFLSFTGNTITSYMVGIYVKGKLDSITRADEHLKAPIRHKIRQGESVRLEEPYEGMARWVRGKIETDGGYGSTTSKEFLEGFYVDGKKHPIALVVTTGTEYSAYLEEARDLNVLTDTYLNMSRILSQNITKI